MVAILALLDLRITSSALASALRSAELAILFVCSGGRFDRHPFANTTFETHWAVDLAGIEIKAMLQYTS